MTPKERLLKEFEGKELVTIPLKVLGELLSHVDLEDFELDLLTDLIIDRIKLTSMIRVYEDLQVVSVGMLGSEAKPGILIGYNVASTQREYIGLIASGAKQLQIDIREALERSIEATQKLKE